MRAIHSMRWILGALVFAFLAAGCGGGEDASPGAMTGEVVKIDASNRTIEVKGAVGESGVYQVDAGTKIMSGDKTLMFSDLAKGIRVAVDGERKGDRMVATYVEVVSD